jgi:GNAT superfamily N-acetyltransferase
MTPDAEISVRLLDSAEARSAIPALADILIDCVRRGASVSFMWPLSRDRAGAFWTQVADGVANGDRLLLTAEVDGEIVGTVQVVFAGPENQPHRADVAKMLVRGDLRRRGLGERLMRAAEVAALAVGKTLLVLDSVTGGDGERLYARLGWQRVGVIPDYALFPDGEPCATTFFYKRLAPAPSK